MDTERNRSCQEPPLTQPPLTSTPQTAISCRTSLPSGLFCRISLPSGHFCRTSLPSGPFCRTSLPSGHFCPVLVQFEDSPHGGCLISLKVWGFEGWQMSFHSQIQLERHHRGTPCAPRAPPHAAALEMSQQISFFFQHKKGEQHTRSFCGALYQRPAERHNLQTSPKKTEKSSKCGFLCAGSTCKVLAVTKKMLSMLSAPLWKPQLQGQRQNSLFIKGLSTSDGAWAAPGCAKPLALTPPWRFLLKKSFGILQDVKIIHFYYLPRLKAKHEVWLTAISSGTARHHFPQRKHWDNNRINSQGGEILDESSAQVRLHTHPLNPQPPPEGHIPCGDYLGSLLSNFQRIWQLQSRIPTAPDKERS